MITQSEWMRLLREHVDDEFANVYIQRMLSAPTGVLVHHGFVAPGSWRELLDSLADLEVVAEVDLFRAEDDDSVDEVWVVAKQITPDAVRQITRTISEVEREFGEVFESRIVPDSSHVPDGAQTVLTIV